MGDEIRIDRQTFHDRLSHFILAWKADKRAGDAVFGGVGSIVILMGKAEELTAFSKNNAMHVSQHRRASGRLGDPTLVCVGPKLT